MDTPDHETVAVMHLEQLSAGPQSHGMRIFIVFGFYFELFHWWTFLFHCSGDEILEVNGESLQGLTHQQAIQTFKVNCSVTPETPAAVHKTSEKN